jgi:lipoate-protein ligase B
MLAVEEKVFPCRVFRLGTMAYEEAFRLQLKLAEARGAGAIGDTLLILEHDPVITIGRSGKIQNILVPQEALRQKNIQVVFTDRGETSPTMGRARSFFTRSWIFVPSGSVFRAMCFNWKKW